MPGRATPATLAKELPGAATARAGAAVSASPATSETCPIAVALPLRLTSLSLCRVASPYALQIFTHRAFFEAVPQDLIFERSSVPFVMTVWS